MTFERTTDKQKILDYGYAAIIKQGKPGIYVDGSKVSCVNWNPATKCYCAIGAFVPEDKRGYILYAGLTDVADLCIVPYGTQLNHYSEIYRFLINFRSCHDVSAALADGNDTDGGLFIWEFKSRIRALCRDYNLAVPQ
jgi:hypothetical protein